MQQTFNDLVNAYERAFDPKRVAQPPVFKCIHESPTCGKIRYIRLPGGSAKTTRIVAMEDLRIKDMTASAKGTVESPGHVAAKSALNRRMLDQGWGELRRQVGYKLKWTGGELKLVDPRNTSRTCSQPNCGYVSQDNRLTQADCCRVKCGHAANADANAAINFLGRAR